MWTKIKWTLRIILMLFVVAFLHYTLPHRDVVRITNTYNKLTQVGANAIFYSGEDVGSGGGAAATNTNASMRDIRFIDAVYPDGDKVVVYRNEDTGWLWPPYFKWDSASLQAEAGNFRSDKANPQWVAITHYGWRNSLLSIYPNAVKITPVAGPDVTLFPWVNVIILLGLAIIFFTIRQMWRQFRERMIDPTIDSIDAHADVAAANARGFWGRATGWFSRKRKG